MTIVCPVDGKDDAIQKVSAIVRGVVGSQLSGPVGGVTHVGGEWAVTGGYSSQRGVVMSRLQQAFTAPAEPGPTGVESLLILLESLLGGLLLVFGVGSGLINLLGGGGIGKGVDCLTLLFLVSGAVFIVSVRLLRRKVRNRAAAQKPAWEAAMARWSRLYYCFRHDLAFDPETGASCAPEAAGQYVTGGRA